MKLGLNDIIGKTIKNVVVVERKQGGLSQQAFLVFSDDTYLEFYGEDFNCTNSLDNGDVEEIMRFLKLSKVETIQVIGEKTHDDK